MKKINTLLALVPFIALSAAACTSTQEVEVTGEVTSAAAVSEAITLSFYEIDKADENAERASIKSVELADLGEFTETVEVTDGFSLIVQALVDSDGDGKCTDGELWAEVEGTIKDDGTVDKLSLALTSDACPAEPAASN